VSAQIIEPDYNWKQAAAQESVDYDAVKKAFMDQAYGFVANKAKVLFQDPYRLGFEIVHRNEKATKMVGIFAFRCNHALLYAPVFFVNGEIKAADMLYRSDVKRFVPLTDEWCAFLVRGANQDSGQMVEKSRQRQPEAYLDRLSYPQRIKYASEQEKEAADGALNEILSHCAQDDPAPRLLVPDVISEFGPDALEKLAALIEGSDAARRFVCETYTEEQLSNADKWLAKQAAENEVEDIYADSLVLVTSPDLCKTAAAREAVVDHGYALIDNRPLSSFNTVIEDAESTTVHELAAPCVADVMKADGDNVRAILLRYDCDLLSGNGPSAGIALPTHNRYANAHANKPDLIYTPEDKEFVRVEDGLPIFGDEAYDADEIKTLSADQLKKGKCYLMVNLEEMSCSDAFCLEDIRKDGDCRILDLVSNYGSRHRLYYAPDRKSSRHDYISDSARFVEAATDVRKYDDNTIRDIRGKWSKVLMDGAGIDKWIRTAGGMTTSRSVEVSKNPQGLFSVVSSDIAGMKKVASDLGRLAAHLTLANDFDMTCDQAGNILDKTIDDSVTRFQVYDTAEKSAFVTRMENMAPWIQGHDPELNVKLDAPQVQVLKTFTPQRRRQLSRYGDHWERGPVSTRESDEDGLPADAIFTKSPEELAQMATAYQMPHIFDHDVLGRMATSMFNTVSQMQQYIPDLETGVDRYFRILFLLRYRPADFEEAYGKDALMEMEQEISELASLAGENLLRLLKRFDLNKYSKQGL
jgi:hypothetical protein